MKKIRTIALVLACLMIAAVFAVVASAETIYFQPETQGDKIYGIPAKTTVANFKKAYPRTIIEVTDKDGKSVASGSKDPIGTGFKVKLVTTVYTAVIFGDLNGNGTIDSNDYLLVKRAYLGTYEASALEIEASGAFDGQLRAVDYMKVKRACLGTYNMNKDYTVEEGYDPDSDNSGWTSGWV